MRTIRFFCILFLLICNSLIWSQSIVRWYTSMGDFEVTLREDLMPITGTNFIDLTNANFYDSLIFHRVIADFMIQDGCPYGTGYGGPGYTIPDEWNPLINYNEPYVIGMANTGQPNSAGSQYFITVEPCTWLNGDYAAFGHVTMGTDIVEAISEVPTDANDKPLVDVNIDSLRIMTPQFIGFIPEEDSLAMNAGNMEVFCMLSSETGVEYSWYVDDELQTEISNMFTFSSNVNGWHEIEGVGSRNGYDYSKIWWVEISGGSGIDDLPIAGKCLLLPNLPNPFNPETQIRFILDSPARTDLSILNIKGELVKTLTHSELESGYHSYIWNGTDHSNRPVASGIYFYRLVAGSQTEIGKAVLLK